MNRAVQQYLLLMEECHLLTCEGARETNARHIPIRVEYRFQRQCICVICSSNMETPENEIVL